MWGLRGDIVGNDFDKQNSGRRVLYVMMSRIALIVFLLTPVVVSAAEEKNRDYDKCAKGVRFAQSDKELDEIAKKGPQHKALVDWLKNKKNWAEIFKTLDERAGFYTEDVAITVDAQPSGHVGFGGGHDGKGNIWLNYERLAQVIAGYRNSIDPVKKIITHEMCHVFPAPTTRVPLFVKEGVGEYVAQKEDQIWSYFSGGKAVNSIDQDVTLADAYGRGHLFFKFVEAKYKQPAAKNLIILMYQKGKNVKDAVKEATGKSWDAIVKEELEWSKNFVKNKGK